jgi:predicted dehydrogenase
MEHQKIRIGLVGCGGRLRTVVRNLLATPDASRLEIVALHDPSSDSVAVTARDLAPQARVCDSWQELVESPEVDWVMIGSWNCFHAEQIVAALRAGKHVFAEKPLATTLDDCLQIRDALREAPGQQFFFGLVLRYAPIYEQIRQLLDQGVIGDLVSLEFNETLDFNHGGYIHGNWRRHREQAGTHLLEKCCHDFDIVNWFLASVPMRTASFGGRDVFCPSRRSLQESLVPGPGGAVPYQSWPDPNRVNPFSEGSSIVDNQVAILEYASGVRATFHTNCHSALPERRLVLLGTRGAIRADAATGIIEWRRIGFDEPAHLIRLISASGHYGADERMAEGLAQTMLGQARPMASMDEALQATVACLGVDRALDDQAVVDLSPLWERVGHPLPVSK